jgi:membrane dipeptidase
LTAPTLPRRDFLRRLAAVAAGGPALGDFLPARGGERPVSEVSTEVEQLFDRAISGDTLVYTEDYTPGLDPPALDAVRISRMTYAFYDVSITPNGRSYDDCLRSVNLWNAAVARNPELLLRADAAADILRAKRERKHAMVYLFQDGYPLERDLSRVRLFHGLGVRVIQLTHNTRNLLGDGYVDRVNGGLSDLGHDAVAVMNDTGVLVDLSHCGEQTTLDAIRHSRRPCAFTHAGCRALLGTERNKTDAQIRALADKGGVIGIFHMSCWLTDRTPASVEDVLDHIDHAVKVAGVEHVGFGSDGPMRGVQRMAEELAGHVQFSRSRSTRVIYTRPPTQVRIPELNGARRLLVLAEGLSRRGYPSADVEKIVGGNFYRLLREVVG